MSLSAISASSVGRPVDRRSHVLLLGQDARKLELLVVVLCQMGRFGDLEHSLGVAPVNPVSFVGLVEPLQCELADRLEHPVALLAEATGAASHEALVEKGRERVEIRFADRFRRLERAAAPEGCKPPEEALLVRVEQVVRPSDGRP